MHGVGDAVMDSESSGSGTQPCTDSQTDLRLYILPMLMPDNVLLMHRSPAKTTEPVTPILSGTSLAMIRIHIV